MHHPDLWNNNAAICVHRSTLATYPYLHPFSHQIKTLLVIPSRVSMRYSESTSASISALPIICALVVFHELLIPPSAPDLGTHTHEGATPGRTCHYRLPDQMQSGAASY